MPLQSKQDCLLKGLQGYFGTYLWLLLLASAHRWWLRPIKQCGQSSSFMLMFPRVSYLETLLTQSRFCFRFWMLELQGHAG
ncbi:unnamed protein product [Ixodes pacificus]